MQKVHLPEDLLENRNEWSIRTHGRSIPLKSSLPFIKSNRGVLTHRVKHGSYHRILHKMSHASIDCYCGMTLFPHRSAFMETPQANEIVCRQCEVKSILDKKPSSSEMAGRHVHIGGIKAFADCCDVVIADDQGEK